MFLRKPERDALKMTFDRKVDREIHDLRVSIICSNAKTNISRPATESEEKQQIIDHLNNSKQYLIDFTDRMIDLVNALYEDGPGLYGDI